MTFLDNFCAGNLIFHGKFKRYFPKTALKSTHIFKDIGVSAQIIGNVLILFIQSGTQLLRFVSRIFKHLPSALEISPYNPLEASPKSV